MKRRTLIAAAGLAVLAVTGVGWQAWAGGGDGTDHYRWATVKSGTVETSVSLSGTVQPAGRATLQFGTAGTVKTVHVSEGDSVATGDVLVTLDTTALKRKLRAARSELKVARATLAAHEAGQQALVSSAASGGVGGGVASSGGTAQGSVSQGSGSQSSLSQGSVDRGSTVTSVAFYRTASTTATTNASSGSVHTVASSSDVTAALSKVQAQQTAVTTAQTAVSTAKQAAQSALATQTAACGAAYANNASDDPEINRACDDALAAVQTAQDDVSTAQDALSSALDALATTLTGASATLQQATDDLAAAEAEGTDGSSGSTSTDGSSGTGTGGQASGGQESGNQDSTGTGGQTQPGAPSGSTGTTGQPGQPGQSGQSGQSEQSGQSGQSEQSGQSGQSGQQPSGEQSGQGGTAGGSTAGDASGSSSSTITAAQLASDQADVDQARADLIAARQNLAGAQVTAPWSGTVASLPVATGDAATSGGTAAVLVAPDTMTVEVAASTTQVKKLEVGQTAEVTPAGASEPVAATVSSVSTDSANGSTFPVVLELTGKSAAASGTPASVSVVTGSAQDTLTVPSSAISNGTVTLRTADGVQTRKVTVGLVGSTLTQVTDGLSAGDQVSLADLSAQVSGAGEITTSRGGFGGGPSGGMPGGGMPDRGFPGGNRG